MSIHIENLEAWLNGEYVSPLDLKESLEEVIKQYKIFKSYIEENSVEAMSKNSEAYGEALMELLEEDVNA